MRKLLKYRIFGFRDGASERSAPHPVFRSGHSKPMRQQPIPTEVAAGTKSATSLMRWAGKVDHLGGIPRALVITAVGAFAKLFTSFLNSTHVYNAETLHHLVHSRSPGRPLITVSNHMSTSVIILPFFASFCRYFSDIYKLAEGCDRFFLDVKRFNEVLAAISSNLLLCRAAS
ncbi:hypothetical protein KFK09_028721 [Dendrobium nobile]|uniref:Tafazzin family protein n=1 Tax=Dendrobium nobile TaxID=94219 RepID=A0A8T3A416_DENNO|nr:hypothetical protein KFK09_028721 [Dendrobium nobile]